MLTIHRCLDILEYLAEKPQPALLNEIAQEFELSTTSAHNFLKALSERGYVKHIGPRKGFIIGRKLIELSKQINTLPLDMADIAKPYLEKLNQLTGESVYLGIFKKGSVQILHSIISDKWLAMGAKETFTELHASSNGKIFLSSLSPEELEQWFSTHPLEKIVENTVTDKSNLEVQLESIREKGYSTCNEELERGSCSIAAPITDKFASIVGTVSVGFPSVRAEGDVWSKFPEYVKETAFSISTEIGKN